MAHSLQDAPERAPQQVRVFSSKTGYHWYLEAFPCALAVRIARHSPYIFAFNMYGHPFWGSSVGHSGEKCDLTLIVYPWFCHGFGDMFDRCLQNTQQVPSVLITLLFWCVANAIHKGTLLSIISWRCVHKRVSRMRVPLFCTARFHDHSDEKAAVHGFVCLVHELPSVCMGAGWLHLFGHSA